jgi:hypothetical protein
MSERETHAQMAMRAVLEHFGPDLAARRKHEAFVAECRTRGYVESDDGRTLRNPANGRSVSEAEANANPDAALRYLEKPAAVHVYCPAHPDHECRHEDRCVGARCADWEHC